MRRMEIYDYDTEEMVAYIGSEKEYQEYLKNTEYQYIDFNRRYTNKDNVEIIEMLIQF